VLTIGIAHGGVVETRIVGGCRLESDRGLGVEVESASTLYRDVQYIDSYNIDIKRRWRERLNL
jgi:hypothetical protein